MSKAKNSALNLPDGILQQYQRRYSDPTPPTSGHTHSTHRPRRFSLTTFSDLQNISSRSVRDRVNQILNHSGHTAYTQSKTSQARRYSVHAHTPVNIDLSDCSYDKGRRWSTFSEKIARDINEGRRMSSGDISKKKSLTSYWNDKDFKDYQKQEIMKKTTQQSPCSNEKYWASKRRNSNDHSDICTDIPKCKYKLRENGLVASEMASLCGVHIQGMDRCPSVNSPRSQIRFEDLNDVDTRPPSTQSSHYKIETTLPGKNNGLGSCPNMHTGVQSPDVTGAPIIPAIQTPDCQYDDYFRYSFYNPSKCDAASSFPANTQIQTQKDSVTSPQPKETPNVIKSKPRRFSEINFEIIGNATLHGSPRYSGRLKLCSVRTVSFQN